MRHLTGNITADDVLPNLLYLLELYPVELSALASYELWRQEFEQGAAAIDGKTAGEFQSVRLRALREAELNACTRPARRPGRPGRRRVS